MASITTSRLCLSLKNDSWKTSVVNTKTRDCPSKLFTFATVRLSSLRGSHLKADSSMHLQRISKRSGALRAQGQDNIRDVTDEVRAEVSGASGQDSVQDALQTAAKSAPEPIKSIAEDAVKGHSPEAKARGAVLHDFCLGIPYGGLLAICALVWGLFVGTLAPAVFAIVVGTVIAVANVASLNTWKTGRSSSFYTALSAGLSMAYAAREVRRFSLSGALFPTGLTAAAGFAMAAFFIYNILAGGNPKSKKKPQAA